MWLKKYNLPLSVAAFTAIILSMIQINLVKPILIAERFFTGGGWFEVFSFSAYGAIVAYNMQDPIKVPKWRSITWVIFSVVFFSQLILGLSGFEKFLMTGELHLPIPAMILSGPIYRGHLSFMTVLFLSTVVLTGPAWCSHLCYFGAFDSLAARGKDRRSKLHNKGAIKSTLILLIIGVTLLFRFLKIPVLIATITAIVFGMAGIMLMIFISRKNGKMVHCLLYCPIGTIINLFKHINPFRLSIEKSCNLCMKCSLQCKYDALNIQDIRNKKPGITCTLCGDCIASCKDQSIKYNFPGLNHVAARNLYLFLTISLHSSFLALARI